MIGFHSVMERPELVRRVAPPTMTVATTMAATSQSQPATHARGPRCLLVAVKYMATE